MEEWPSGLWRTPGKRVGVNAPPGFESPFLRHFIINQIKTVFYDKYSNEYTQNAPSFYLRKVNHIAITTATPHCTFILFKANWRMPWLQ